MVESSRSRGLDASQGDAFAALEAIPDQSLAGVSAIQVVEHLPWESIQRLIALAYRKLRVGGCLILETINPFSIYAWRSFYVDPTHRQPVPEPTCRFLLELTGFGEIESHFLHPVKDPELTLLLQKEPALKPFVDYLFGFQDYAVVGWRTP
jgi:O-antigen chain-terminating methyltransferase